MMRYLRISHESTTMNFLHAYCINENADAILNDAAILLNRLIHISFFPIAGLCKEQSPIGGLEAGFML